MAESEFKECKNRDVPITNLYCEEMEITRKPRHYRPTHYLLKIQSYSLLINTGVEKYESGVFEVGGHKWRLSIYPKGNLKMNGPTNHISVYLEIVDIEKYSLGWEVYASFKLFVFNQKRDQFVTIQDADGEIRRFHDVKTEWGFNKFLSLDSFNCHCNGYLVNDCCVFGAEVFVHERSGKREFLSLIKDPPNGVMTWKLEDFSALNKKAYYSQVFAIGDLKWKLLLYPKGISDGVPKAISLFLCSCDCLDHFFQSEHKYFAEFKLRIRDQINNNHVENSGKHWFSNSSNECGFSQFLFLKDLQDSSMGYLENDTLIVQAEIFLMSTIK